MRPLNDTTGTVRPQHEIPLDADRSRLAASHVGLADALASRATWHSPRFAHEIRSGAYRGLLSAAARYDASRGPFGPYARRGIDQAIRNAIRDAARDAWPAVPPAALDALAAHLGRCPRPDRFEELIESLDERSRDVLRAAHVEGLSDPDIGRRLGLSRNRVMQLRHAALARLRDRLGHLEAAS